MARTESGIFRQARKWLVIAICVAFFFEMILFPSIENFLGGIMATLTCIVYCVFFLNRQIVLQYPFAFMMYSSMFLYRYLPLIATLVEGNPITLGFELAIETFSYEILLFLISSIAFHWACPRRSSKKNNRFQKILIKSNLFETTPSTPKILWSLGLIGLASRLYIFANGLPEFGDVFGKFLWGIDYLIHAPLLLLFPSLIHLPPKKNTLFVSAHLLIITVISMASNSRHQMIEPVFIIFILYLLDVAKNNLEVTKLFSKRNIVVAVLFFLFGLNFFSDMSLAMLYNRSVRYDLSAKELFDKTLSTYNDEYTMASLRSIADAENFVASYESGWNENYIDNFMLNRYANIRISDQTLYHAKKRGFENTEMQTYFFDKTLALFPTPVLEAFGLELDKRDISYSPGDLLISGKSLGSRIVSSHVGNGLATFGYWYFPIQLILCFFVFKLLNTFVCHSPKRTHYAPYALIQVFMFLGMFRNAGGCYHDLTFILRGYIQGIFTYLVIYTLLKLFFSAQKNLRINV